MKKSVILLVAVSVLALLAVVYAQGPGMTGGGQGCYCPYCGQYLGPRGGYGMGPGMMGPGHGMMGGYGMTGPGYFGKSEECQKFLNETAGLRKELHNKRFEYSETLRDPKTTPESAAKHEKEIRELYEKIYAKTPHGCWW